MILEQETFGKFGYWPKDLSKGSSKKIIVQCDYCHKQRIVRKADHSVENFPFKYSCKPCLGKKHKEICLQRYGVVNIACIPKVKKKREQTFFTRYGVLNIGQLMPAHEKAKQTLIKKFGVINVSQLKKVKRKKLKTFLQNYGITNPEKRAKLAAKIKQAFKNKYNKGCPNKDFIIRQKIILTNILRYGYCYALQVEKIKKKGVETNIRKYGYKNYMQSPKLRKRFIKNLTRKGICISNFQEQLGEKLTGLINVCIEGYYPDILLTDRNIIIECDGSGHNLNVQFKNTTQSEFDAKEEARDNTLIAAGYKILRVKNPKDKPLDFLNRHLIELNIALLTTTNCSKLSHLMVI